MRVFLGELFALQSVSNPADLRFLTSACDLGSNVGCQIFHDNEKRYDRRGATTKNCKRLSNAGEIAELKADLQSEKRDRKKEAVKKVIASMTVGKDVR